MEISITEKKENSVKIAVEGKLETAHAAEFSEKMKELLKDESAGELILDLEKLEYIASSGLREILILTQNYKASLINLSPEIYEIFDTVGFTKAMDVRKKPRVLEVKELELVGRGSTGIVYRMDEDKVVKAFYPYIAPDYVETESEIARKVFFMGLPAAVVFDVVKTEENFGIVYEMVDAKSLSAMVENSDSEEDMQKCAVITNNLFKQIHDKEIKNGEFGKCFDFWMGYFSLLEPHLTEDEFSKVKAMMASIPDRNTFVHGDFHPGNIMMRGDEPVLIDVSTASSGHPIYDLAALCSWSKILANALGDEGARTVTGVGKEKLIRFWDTLLKEYCKDCPEKMQEIDDWCTAFGAVRVYSAINTPNMFPEEGLNWCKAQAFEILNKGLKPLE